MAKKKLGCTGFAVPTTRCKATLVRVTAPAAAGLVMGLGTEVLNVVGTADRCLGDDKA